MLKDYELSRSTRCAALVQHKPRRKATTMQNEEPMTQERREKFWKQYGWSPELPEDHRKRIEDYWSDQEIEEAEALGF